VPLARASDSVLLARASDSLLEILEPYSLTDPLADVAPPNPPPASPDSTIVTATPMATPLLPFPWDHVGDALDLAHLYRSLPVLVLPPHRAPSPVPPRTAVIVRCDNCVAQL